jgi:hypothetical protein
MKKRSIQEQVISGLQLAGSVLLACLVGTLFVWGALLISHEVRGSAVMGCVALGAGLVILVSNLDGWARMLPGFLALAAFNSLVMAASGHVLNSPSTQVSRSLAIGSAAALVVGSVASVHFHGKKLSSLDRFVLVAYVGFLLLGFVSRWVVFSLALGALVLAIPYLVSLIRSERKG